MKRLMILPFLFLITFKGGEAQVNSDNGKLKFTVRVNNELNNYKVLGVYKMAGQIVEIEQIEKDHILFLSSSEGVIRQEGNGKWHYKTPGNKGLYQVYITNSITGEIMQLNVFDKVPYSDMNSNGELNGYKIGKYPSDPFKGNPRYKKPEGFIEVTAENLNTHISPHFTLKQFLCKQASDYPKYLTLNERLILKLEYILEEVNKKGYACKTFYIMSGYRTPFYNGAIGNVKYSRHVYGDAADIFIDENGDGKMDDLDNDGQITEKDVKILYNIIDELYQKKS